MDKKNRNIIGYILISLGFLFVLGIIFKVFLSGYLVYQIHGSSMSPTYNDSDHFICKKNIDVLEEGDIIVYEIPIDNYQVAHRIVEKIDNSSFRTKGDGNNYTDRYIVERKNVVCKNSFFNRKFF